MKKMRNVLVFVLILCLFLTVTACQKKEESSPPPKDEFKALESPLEDMEAGLIEVMSMADYIPYFEKQITAKKQKEEEEKQRQTQTTGQPPAKEEFKPEPATLNDTILSDVVNQELDAEKKMDGKPIPEEIIFTWNDINGIISKLHEQWNNLQPKLAGVNVPEKVLTDFGNALNNLTIAGTENKFMETLLSANKATGHLAEFMKASKDDSRSALYYVKYYAREIVLNTANNDYVKAAENLQALRSQAESLGYKLVEKKAKDEADKLTAAVDDMENALNLKDLNLLKVEASVVVKDIVAAREKLEQ